MAIQLQKRSDFEHPPEVAASRGGGKANEKQKQMSHNFPVAWHRLPIIRMRYSSSNIKWHHFVINTEIIYYFLTQIQLRRENKFTRTKKAKKTCQTVIE